MRVLKYPNHRQTGFDFRFRFPRKDLKDLKDQAPKTESDKQALDIREYRVGFRQQVLSLLALLVQKYKILTQAVIQAMSRQEVQTYADVCWRMLTSADVCRRMLQAMSREEVQSSMFKMLQEAWEKNNGFDDQEWGQYADVC